MKEKKRVTISDIARETGYSKTAISFAFNAPTRISREAREKILKTAERLKYIPDPMARNFSLGKHQSIGFLLPQDTEAALANPYIVDVIRGLGSRCQEKGYTLTIIPPLNNSIFEAVKNAMVDGLVTMGYILDENADKVIDQRNLPLVMIDGTEGKNILSINIDDTAAAYTQLKATLDAGHRDLSIISLYAPAYTELDNAPKEGLVEKRLFGYKKALEEVGIRIEDVPTYIGKTTRNSGLEIAAEILSLPKRPSAVISMSDIIAIGVIKGLMAQGVRVPEDISVVGFDNIREADLIEPQLTTIAQPAYDKGQKAADALFALINGEEFDKENCQIPFTLIERNTLKRL